MSGANYRWRDVVVEAVTCSKVLWLLRLAACPGPVFVCPGQPMAGSRARRLARCGIERSKPLDGICPAPGTFGDSDPPQRRRDDRDLRPSKP